MVIARVIVSVNANSRSEDVMQKCQFLDSRRSSGLLIQRSVAISAKFDERIVQIAGAIKLLLRSREFEPMTSIASNSLDQTQTTYAARRHARARGNKSTNFWLHDQTIERLEACNVDYKIVEQGC